MNSLFLTDGYKVDHRRQYPEGTSLVYSNWTPRKSRIDGVNEVTLFGLQYFMQKYLIEDFNTNFFSRPKDEVVSEYSDLINAYLGPNSVGNDHIAKLHDLGFLPIEIKALPEGVKVPIRVPMFVMFNTMPDFFWVTNYLETLISSVIWMPCTSATIAGRYKQILSEAAEKTSSMPDFVNWQGHDFSMRGMAGVEAAILSAMGHLIHFTGTDTIPAIKAIEKYYGGNLKTDLIGGSVSATEHSVMCMGTMDNEIGTFKRLITEVYPKGIVSIVSDTWDLWRVLTEYVPALKDEILSRDGKVVIRPDSGDPVDIICGAWEENRLPSGNYEKTPKSGHEGKGVIELLWDVFGGTINDKGYKELNPKIGAIYGDSITTERAKKICSRLEAKGFASTNLVLGIGSYTYQYNTRDTFGFAMKATYGEVDGIGLEIFKDPVTDDGTKKSAKGLMRVELIDGKYQLFDSVAGEDEGGELTTVFRNGEITKTITFNEIRENASVR